MLVPSDADQHLRQLLRDAFGRHVAEGRLAGYVATVWLRGEILFTDAVGYQDAAARIPMREDTILRIASMTKPIVAAAVLKLVEAGRLLLDDPVGHYLPELENLGASRAPTLRDLLLHTGGLSYGFSASAGNRALHSDLLGDGPFYDLDPAEWIVRLATIPLECTPGERWHYSVSYDLLGMIVARALGSSLQEALQALILDPAGMADTKFWVVEADRHRLASAYALRDGSLDLLDEAGVGRWSRPPVFPSGGAGLVSTNADCLKFATMLLNGGEIQGARVLSPASVELMTTNHLSMEQRRPVVEGLDLLRGRGAGFGLFLNDNDTARSTLAGRSSFEAHGAFSNCWLVDRERSLIGVFNAQLFQDTALRLPPRFLNMLMAWAP